MRCAGTLFHCQDRIAGYIAACIYCPQMRMAYEAVMFQDVEAINYPPSLHECCSSHIHLTSVSATLTLPSFPPSRFYASLPHQVGEQSGTRFAAKPQQGELWVSS